MHEVMKYKGATQEKLHSNSIAGPKNISLSFALHLFVKK